MFGLFKKKKSLSTGQLLLSYSHQDFVSKVTRIIEEMPPNARSMIVVAYQNQEPMMKVASAVFAKNPTKLYPSTIEEYIIFFERELEKNSNNEIIRRRMGHFLFAALVRRVENLWHNNKQFDKDMGKIWIALADACYCLPHLISTIVIWSEQEKLWFLHLQQAKESIEYCLNHVAPKEIRVLTSVRDYAKSKDLWFSA